MICIIIILEGRFYNYKRSAYDAGDADAAASCSNYNDADKVSIAFATGERQGGK